MRGRQQAAPARRPWHVSGAHLLFHYTQPEHAAAIAEEFRYVVSSHRRHGRDTGFFLTNLEPGRVSTADLLRRLWSDQFGEEQVRGVVVVRRQVDVLPVTRIALGEWLHQAEPGSVIDLTEVLVGYGVRLRDDWLWSDGL